MSDRPASPLAPRADVAPAVPLGALCVAAVPGSDVRMPDLAMTGAAAHRRRQGAA